MLSVVKLTVVMLGVIILRVVAPNFISLEMIFSEIVKNRIFMVLHFFNNLFPVQIQNPTSKSKSS
jgi:hypothetical protein